MASGTGISGNGNGSGDGPAWHASGTPDWEPVSLARQDSVRIGPLTIDPPARRIAHDDGREETLEPRMMQVLVALIRARGAVLSREILIGSCWDGRIVGDEAISSVVYRLRRALKQIAGDSVRVETIAKVGFRLVCDPFQPEAVGGGTIAARNSRPNRAARWAKMAAAVAGVVALSLVAGPTVPGERSFAAAAAVAPALAVMPFADLSPGRDNGYFAEGMAEEIMGLVSDEPGLRVIGRTSIEMLGEGAGINEARERLGVTHVLEGSVRRSGQALRVNVRLIDARDGSQLWAKEFDRSLGDVFAIQDDIGAQVLTRLRGSLALRSGAPETFKTSPEVYDLYLGAIALERDERRPSSIRAKSLLERAIRLDPNYAPAYARLASYGREVWVPGGPRRGVGGQASGPGPVPPESLAYARRALELAPNLGDAHAAMGALVEDEWNWAQAIPHLERAVELDPGNFLAWDMLGHVQQMHLCRLGEAEASFRRAVAIEPLVAGPRYSLTLIHAEMGRFAEASAAARGFTSVSRDITHLPKFRRMISFYSGDLSTTVVDGREAIRLDPENGSIKFGQAQAFRALGLSEAAERILPAFERPVAAPLVRGDFKAAAAAAIDGGERIWKSGPGYRAFAVAALIEGGRDDWLLRSFDRAYPSVEAFDEQLGCRHSIFIAPQIVLALRRNGRAEEAARLLRLTNARLQQWEAAGRVGVIQELAKAKLHVLAGRRHEALTALEQATARGWVDQFWPFLSLSDTLFDPLRPDPRFRSVERRIQSRIRRERAELARLGSA